VASSACEECCFRLRSVELEVSPSCPLDALCGDTGSGVLRSVGIRFGPVASVAFGGLQPPSV
jgi:hypothetical protein